MLPRGPVRRQRVQMKELVRATLAGCHRAQVDVGAALDSLSLQAARREETLGPSFSRGVCRRRRTAKTPGSRRTSWSLLVRRRNRRLP